MPLLPLRKEKIIAAKNYTRCPVCAKRASKEKNKRHAAAAKAYGNVTADKYHALLAKADRTEILADTLGEYYEHWFDAEGTYRAKYHVNCDVCGFTFKHESVVPNAVKE